MKRVVLVAFGSYLLVAVGNRVAETAGALRCGCAQDCWCQRPGLGLFRWVCPWRHRGAHTADEKAGFEHAKA